jgi:TolA-binding protein
MDTQLDTTSATTSAAPVPTPTPAPPAPAPEVKMDYGGGGGSSFMETIKSLNPLEILFGVLAATTLYYTIYYYRHSIQIGKSKTDLENKIDELEIKISDLSSAIQSQKQKQEQQNNNTNWI